jgi:hypothetical protein
VAGGANASLPNRPRGFTASAYFARAAGPGDDARIRIYDLTNSATLSTGNTIKLSSTFQRSVAGFNLGSYPAGINIRVIFETVTQHSTVFYVDGIQCEYRSEATPYCDGDMDIFTEWDGTAHASTSRRNVPIRSIRGFTLTTDKAAYVLITNALGKDASATIGRYMEADTTWYVDRPIHAKKISFINAVAGERPVIYGEVWGI